MTTVAAITWNWPWGVVAGLILVCAAILVTRARGLALGRVTVALGAVGGLLLACGAGLPAWNRPVEKWAAVMVDLSASTRGAGYRNRDMLEKRIAELLGNVPHRVSYFADGLVEPPPAGNVLAEVLSDKTVFPVPPGAAAVLLFSDCRFELPSQIAQTYIVVDPGLEDVDDARVTSLQIRGNEVAAAIANGGKTRGVNWRGVTGGSTGIAPTGSIVLTRKFAAGAPGVSAGLTAGDAWPENDALSATIPPPETLERWWIGAGTAPPGWRAMLPSDLAADSGPYLAASVIVLDNVSAGDLSEARQQRLLQYVRDAGGGVAILGGDRAFGAGGYGGTPLEQISPLASRPPEPTVHWVVLVDQSGSMGSPVEGGGTRWDYAAKTVNAIVSSLPPEDLASVGGFAETVNWWASGKRVKDLATAPLPPANAYPHGPTNLEPALESVLRVGGTMPVQLLVMSDFDAKISDATNLSSAFKSKNVRVHVLAIGDGSALKTMQDIASATGGGSMTQLDPSRWAASARELLRASLPNLVRRDPVLVKFAGALNTLPSETASVWNRTWAVQGSTELAQSTVDTSPFPMAAHRNVGEGRVVAAAFKPELPAVDAMTKLVERKPHDPRFRVTCEAGAKVHVTVDGVEDGKFLNGKQITVELLDQSATGASAEVIPMMQTGPGKYEISLSAPRSPRLATVRSDGQSIGRFALAGRYAMEFDAVGNDHTAMDELARRSGGRVIGPAESQPIKMDWPAERVPLSSEFGIAGATLLLGALWRWRRS